MGDVSHRGNPIVKSAHFWKDYDRVIAFSSLGHPSLAGDSH